MKLIYCPYCTDVVRLIDKRRECMCGDSWGYYTNNIDAVIGGEAIPLGFNNIDFMKAIRARPEEGLGSRFEAFVIPQLCPTINDGEET